jgi:hypothetical protein
MGTQEIVSLDQHRFWLFKPSPEYGNLVPPLADFIRFLLTKCGPGTRAPKSLEGTLAGHVSF